MDSFNRLSRRDFLDRTLKLGAAGFAVSSAATSIESAFAGAGDPK